MNYDKILFGKSDIERIVSIEVKDNVCELFIQKDNGDVESIFEKNKFWVLCDQTFGNYNWARLKGEQHYKYGVQFDTKEDFLKFRYRTKDKDLYSIYDSRESIMVKNGYGLFRGLTSKDLTVLSFDLETTGLDTQASDALAILISTTFRKKGIITKRLFSYDEFESEGEMIESFASYIRELDPSVLIGHNIVSFDLKYLIERATINNVNFNVGRDGSSPEVGKKDSDFRMDGSRDIHFRKIRIYGREIIDTMFLAYNMDVARKYESYGLKSIIKQEGLEIEGRVFYDASQIRFKYKDPEEFKKIKQYCINDSDDALNLFDKLVPIYFSIASLIPKTFQATNESASGSKLNAMLVRAYLQDGKAIAKTSIIGRVPGGLSFGIPGIYNNIVKLDFSSLYPSIILQYQVSNKEKDPEGYLYYITKTMRQMRLEYKKKYKETGDEQYNFMDTANKSILNSLYGLLATPGLNYNCEASASFITNTARRFLKEAIAYVTEEPYEVYHEKYKEHIDAE